MRRKTNIHLATSDTCTGCSACASICPTKSIIMHEDNEGFLQPYIDVNTCVECHKCEKICPLTSPISIPKEFKTQAFAAINKDEEVRMRSSSGGIFHSLAKWTIEQGGVVFGARFNEQWEVVHDYTEKPDGIEPFMRSKYVQSRIDSTFKQAKQFIEQGRKVLFVGTPCQIGGLKSYLHKEYDNLLTVDFICHGVPSPKVWKSYLKGIIGKDSLLDVNFRDKSDGWLNFQCVTTTTTTRREQQLENPYFRGFLNNVYLRNSCYKCQFKTIHRISDITLADAWGIQNFCPEMHDDKGTSAIFIHSTKGQKVLETLSGEILLNQQRIVDVLENNTMMNQSVSKTSKRKRFFFYFQWIPFEKMHFAINKDWMLKRIYGKFKKAINKLYKRKCQKK